MTKHTPATPMQAAIVTRGLALYDGCKHEVVDVAHGGLMLRDPFDDDHVFLAPWSEVSEVPQPHDEMSRRANAYPKLVKALQALARATMGMREGEPHRKAVRALLRSLGEE